MQSVNQLTAFLRDTEAIKKRFFSSGPMTAAMATVFHRIIEDHGKLADALEKNDYESYLQSAPALSVDKKQKAESKPTCQGTTKKNQPCKKKALEGQNFCLVHKQDSVVEDNSTESKRDKTRCCGTTRKGTPCTRNALGGLEFCSQHKDSFAEVDSPVKNSKLEKQKCTGTTKKGEPCKKNAIEGEEFCYRHIDAQEVEVETKNNELIPIITAQEEKEEEYEKFEFDEEFEVTKDGFFYQQEDVLVVKRNYLILKLHTSKHANEEKTIQLEGDYQIYIGKTKSETFGYALVSKDMSEFPLPLVRDAIRIIKELIGESDTTERELELKGYRIFERDTLDNSIAADLDAAFEDLETDV